MPQAEPQLSRPQFEIKGLTELGGMLVVTFHAAATASLLGCRLEVIQGNRSAAATPDHWFEVPSHPMDGQGRSEVQRLLAVIPTSENPSSWKRGEAFEVLVRSSEAVVGRVSCTAETMTPERLANSRDRAVLARAFAAHGRSDIAALLAMSIKLEPAERLQNARIDHVAAAGTGLVVEGHAWGQPNLPAALVSGDLQNWLFSSAFAVRPAEEGHQGPGSEVSLSAHGCTFTAVMQTYRGGTPVYLVQSNPADRAVTFYGPLQATQHSDIAALQLVYTAFGDLRAMDPDEVDRIYRPLLSTSKESMSAQVFDFGPKLRQDRPVASVIVPFYGDAFFMNCVHYLQRVLDDGFELVLVVDDPRIWAEVYNSLALRSTGLRVPTRLLRNMANYGYGGANNIAASLSRGDVLFLMNSDILVKDPAGLVKAAEEIRDRKRAGGREVVVGFSLLYEDNTIQHLGMTFPRSSAMGNLLVADHPMKGLPFDLYDGDAIRPAQAVTAALMALSKDLFTELGGFDLRYERGDFEDADLCLRARQRGAEIQVHVHPGLYHLERQSIPSMGDADIRSMVTYMNCAEFNRRWEAELTRPRRVFKVSGSKATA